MAWAVAFIAILGVGLPVAAWWYSGRRPPSPVTRLGTSIDRINDRIDKWLLKEYQLAPLDRGRIRDAVDRRGHISNHRARAAAELAHFRELPTDEHAVSQAALGKDPTDRRHSHQRRLPRLPPRNVSGG